MNWIWFLWLWIGSLLQEWLIAFAVEIDLKGAMYTHSNAQELMDTLSKHHMNARLRSRGGIEVDLKKIAPTHLFTTFIEVGSDRQRFKVILDTGSSNLWLVSSLCSNAGHLSAAQKFDWMRSRTFNVFRTIQEEIVFGSGSIVCFLGSDDVKFGSVQINQQQVAVATEIRGQVFQIGDFTGVLGLAFPALSLDGSLGVFDRVLAEGLLEYNAFSFWVTDSNHAKFILGRPQSKYFVGDMIYTPVTEEYFWKIKCDDILLGGRSLGACSSAIGCSCVLDSGTSVNTVPTAVLDAVLKDFGPQSTCDGYNMNLTYVVGGKNFTLTPEEYLHEYNDTCRPKLLPLNLQPPHGPLFILGELFMSKFYTVFDRERSMIGMALSAQYISRSAPASPLMLQMSSRAAKMSRKLNS